MNGEIKVLLIGGISAYKTLDLIRLLVYFEIKTILTKSKKFVNDHYLVLPTGVKHTRAYLIKKKKQR